MVVTAGTARLTKADIERFVETGKSEDVTIDFKQEPYKRSDDDKREFLKDAVAFGNTLGGHIVIGMAEDDGNAASIHPITETDFDKEIQWLENLCKDCIEPNMTGVDPYTVEVEGGHLLVIKIPKSWSGPHRANSGKYKRFFQRHSRTVSEMDVSQLKQAFLGSSTVFQRAAKISSSWAYQAEAQALESAQIRHDKEQGQIVEGLSSFDADLPNEKDGIFVLHIIPIGNLADRTTLPFESLEALGAHFRPFISMGYNSRINLEGVRFYNSGIDEETYTQVHRNGSLELVAEGLVWQVDGGRELLGKRIVEGLTDCLDRLFRGLRMLECSPPLYIQLRILRVKNTTLDTGVPSAYWSHGEPVFSRNEIVLPEIILTEYPDGLAREDLVRQLTDPLWNAYGRGSCPLVPKN